MKSEKEIQEEITHLLILEKETAEDIKEIINEGSNYLDIYIQKANAIQNQRIALEWVLNKGDKIK